jgi:hypothetical protein
VTQFGTIERLNATLRIRVPKSRLADLSPAIEILRGSKAAVLSLLAPPDPVVLCYANNILNRAGVRLMELSGVSVAGIWSDLDGPQVREALRIFGMTQVRYLDGPDIPLRHKLRRVPGEPVPDYVRVAMEQHPEAPWEVRDRMATKFSPWPLNQQARAAGCIDPKTGIKSISEWGADGRGFVSHPRIGPDQPVIPRTNRSGTRRRRSPNGQRQPEKSEC